jgi:hypothetical protein
LVVPPEWDVEVEAAYSDELPFIKFIFSEAAQLRIMNLADFTDRIDMFSGEVQHTAEGVSRILAERPDLTTLNDIPYFAAGAAAAVKASLDYVDFQNGSGYRFLTHYTQNFTGQEALTYAYVGMTSDGKYLIAADFPIISPETPPTFDLARFNSAEGAEYFDAYKLELVAFYESLSPDAYQPSITTLDALIASIRIAGEPPVTPAG